MVADFTRSNDQAPNGVERSVSTSKLELFRLLGITFQIDLAWMLVFALMAFSLAAQFSKEYPSWSVAHYWIVGIVTCLLFFVSIILHELAHCLVARAAGLSVQSITLFILGGVSHIGKEVQRAGIEFLVSVAGPLASVAISASFAILHVATRSNFETVAAVAEWWQKSTWFWCCLTSFPRFRWTEEEFCAQHSGEFPAIFLKPPALLQ